MIAVLLALAPAARAEDLVAYDTEGDADASGGDPRVAALDEAFARAVTLALGEVVAPSVRTANRAVLDRELVGRARMWVAKFTVTKDATVDGRRQLEVTVRVDRDKLRAQARRARHRDDDPRRGVARALGRGAAPGQRAVGACARATARRPRRICRGSARWRARCAAAGWRSSGRRRPARRRARGGALPLADDEAEALATDAKADLVAIAGVDVGPPVLVRGQPVSAALVTAHVRVLERRGRKVVGQGQATVAARGQEPSVIDHAIDQALVDRDDRRAAAAAPGADASAGLPGRRHAGRRARRGPGPARAEAPRGGWSLAEQKYLSGAKGVRRAVLRRVSPGGWVIGVTTTESIERIAAIAKQARRPPTRRSRSRSTARSSRSRWRGRRERGARRAAGARARELWWAQGQPERGQHRRRDRQADQQRARRAGARRRAVHRAARCAPRWRRGRPRAAIGSSSATRTTSRATSS